MSGSRQPALYGRGSECATLDGLLERVRGGHSAVLVIRGEAGAGKTALLDYAARVASGFRIVRAAGIESERELAFAALHQLCGPLLDRLGQLPVPQRDALGAAFGLTAAHAPDRFLVGLAIRSLLSDAGGPQPSDVGGPQPLLCVVDDTQWLDRASAQALAFTARRLHTEPVLMLFTVREPDGELRGLPELLLGGLRDGDARALLDQVVRWPLDERVVQRMVAETRGNPLALLELLRGQSPAELAGGFGRPDAAALAPGVEDGFLPQIEGLPAPTRMLLLVAAAEPTGRPELVWRAAAGLGLALGAATAAGCAELVEFGAQVRFRHPLLRSALYRAAPAADRLRAHHELAQATDPRTDPDYRAWHRAQAAAAPDEQIAAELAQLADRAQARGGVAAAAAFLERAAELTPDPARQACRAVAAAQAKHQAGAPDAAGELLARAEAGLPREGSSGAPPDPLLRARVSLLHGQLAFTSGPGCDAAGLLLDAARQFEPVAPELAREAYLDALAAGLFAGRMSGGVTTLPQLARAARAAPPAPRPPRAPDLLMDGLATVIDEGYPAGAPVLDRAVTAFRRGDLPAQDVIRWSFVACHAAQDLWDDEAWHELSARNLQLARGAGVLSLLPLVLAQRAGLLLHAGEFAAAAALVEETAAITTATGQDLLPYGALAVAGWQGRPAEAGELIQATLRRVSMRGEGMGLSLTLYTLAVLSNGLGRYEDALAAADRASAHPAELGFANVALAELIEAAARLGETQRAADALDQLTRTTQPCATPWARGVEARSRALLSDGDEAELLYQEALDQLKRSRGVVLMARTHLLYGEWLRRASRRVDARAQLRQAHEMLVRAGARAFAERARRELAATGETTRKRTERAHEDLTAQERQIAQRAREGRTNSEIGTELFLSPRTVEWHLRKIFTKLAISSRRELTGALPELGGLGLPA
ncbi:MAG TPA: AAA family ATPase [Streptosporangiaceae bacterium]